LTLYPAIIHETMSLLTATHLPNLRHRGKVRDTYDLANGLLLMVATDRISAFDVVLPTGIPKKGIILSKLSAFWFQKVAHIMPHHLVAMADDEAALAAHQVELPPGLGQEVRQRAMVVRQAQRIDVECVVRGYLSGSAWAEYKETGTAGGLPLPKGLKESDKLPTPIFTPTTKAEVGHDMPLSTHDIMSRYGDEMASLLAQRSTEVYNSAAEYAQERGIIIADTKMEFGIIDGKLSLIDELLTPDSSRFWDISLYEPGGPQPSFDKQFVRDWLTQQGWNREPPAPELPPDVVAKTAEKYAEAYRRLTGDDLNEVRSFLAKVYVTLKPTVNDPQGLTVRGGLQMLGFQQVQSVRMGKYIELRLEVPSREKAEEQVREMCRKLLANPVIEQFRYEIEESLI